MVELTDSNLSCLKESGRDALILCKICDISNRAALKQLLERDISEALGSIDILVNSAGIVECEVPDKLIGVNLVSGSIPDHHQKWTLTVNTTCLSLSERRV